MATTWMRGKGQLTIPLEIRKALQLEEGDPVALEITDSGILLRPQKMIDADQAWFWSEAWQAGEREASADIESGRVEIHKTSDDFLSSLDD